MPRYGYRLLFADKLENINYFGCGPDECYEDKREYATPDWYDYLMDDSKNSYEKPQECNSRTGTRWLRFNASGVDFEVSSDKFSFCATSYDVNECWKLAHKKDMIANDGSFLHIDYRMSGVGSRSCGGEYPQPDCRVNPGDKIDFSFVIKTR